MVWCTTCIIDGLDFCVIPKLLVTFFLFPLINVLNIHIYIHVFCDPFCSQFGTRSGLDRKRKGYCKKTEVNKCQPFFRDTDVITWASSFVSLPFPLSIRSMVSAGSRKGNVGPATVTWIV